MCAPVWVLQHVKECVSSGWWATFRTTIQKLTSTCTRKNTVWTRKVKWTHGRGEFVMLGIHCLLSWSGILADAWGFMITKVLKHTAMSTLPVSRIRTHASFTSLCEIRPNTSLVLVWSFVTAAVSSPQCLQHGSPQPNHYHCRDQQIAPDFLMP